MASLSSYYPQPVIAGTTAGTYAEGNASRIIDVTHAGLLSLMGSQSLKAGFHYRITDFVTEYMSNDSEWISPSNTANVSNNNGTAFTVASIAATPEPLIVYAFSSSEVSKQAYSELHPSDIIHYDPSLTYLDGTRAAKGFITYRKDNLRDVSATYDWRNVRFKIWNIDPTAGANPIPLWQNGTTYTVGQYLRNATGQVFQCIETTTTEPIDTSDLTSNGTSDWRPFCHLDHTYTFGTDLAFTGPSVGGVPSGGLGGRNEAKYVSTFCRDFSNPSLDTSSNIRDIKIECFRPTVNSVTRYSDAIRPHVLMRGAASSSLLRLSFKESNAILLQAGGLSSTATVANVFVENCGFVNLAIRLLGAGSSNISIKHSSNFNLFISKTIAGSRFSCVYTGSNEMQRVSNSSFYTQLTDCFFNNCSKTTTTLGNLGAKYDGCANCVISHSGNYSDIGFNINPLATDRNKVFGFVPLNSDSVFHYNIDNLPVCEFTNRDNAKTIVPHIDDEKLIFKVSNSGILNKISEISNVNDSLPLFSTRDDVTPSYTRNASNWLGESAELLTGYSPWNSAYGDDFGCIAITPRHIWFAKHITTSLTGATIRFITNSNTVVERTISRTINSQVNFDVGIALLNSDLPESINIVKILPASASKKFTSTVSSSGSFWINKDKEALITTISAFSNNSASTQIPFSSSDPNYGPIYVSGLDENQRAFYKNVVVGDSGSPLFLLINNEPVLVGLAFSAPNPANDEGGELQAIWGGDIIAGGSNIPINTLITNIDTAQGISTGYTATYFNDSNFENVS
jgi:hypothetical protein